MSNPNEEYPGHRPDDGHGADAVGRTAYEDTTSYPTSGEDTASYRTASYAGTTTSPHAGPAPQKWARGTSWATVAFGLVCMAVAGLALTFELADFEVDWEVAGPASIVGVGLLLVLVGLAGLLSRRQDEEE